MIGHQLRRPDVDRPGIIQRFRPGSMADASERIDKNQLSVDYANIHQRQ